MMRVPDLAHMQVNVRIHEAFINRMEVKARLEEVREGGPADKAGLKPGDIITKIGNKPIKSYPALLEALRSQTRQGQGQAEGAARHRGTGDRTHFRQAC